MNNWSEEKEKEFRRLCEIERINLGRELLAEEQASIWEILDPPEEPVTTKTKELEEPQI